MQIAILFLSMLFQRGVEQHRRRSVILHFCQIQNAKADNRLQNIVNVLMVV